MSEPVYIVAVSYETAPANRRPGEKPKPMIWETFLDGAKLPPAKLLAARLEARGYGPCRIGRVVWEGEPGFEPDGKSE
jgi:hypothetical protein